MLPTFVISPLTSAEPLNDCPHINLLVASVVAVVALPVREALIVDGNFNVTASEPFTLTAVPVLVVVASEIDIFLAVFFKHAVSVNGDNAVIKLGINIVNGVLFGI